MKRNKIVLLAAILMVGLSSNAFGQTYDARLVQTINGSFLDVDVQIGNAPVGFVLGTSTFLFNYNTLALSGPTKVAANDGPWDINSDLDYLQVGIPTGTGFVGLTVEFGGGDDDNGALAAVVFTRVGTVRFTIINASLTPDLVWRNIGSNTQVFRLTTPGSGTGQTDITATGTFIPPANDPLPITLSSFAGQVLPNNGGVRLDWTTLSEIENYGFNVERKRTSEQIFVELPNSFIQGHGTTNEPHQYTYTDATTTAGSWQYRLKQIDMDGTVHHTDPVQVDVLTDVKETAPIVFALLQNYPNPFNPETEIKFSVDNTARTTLRIYNLIGQEVATIFDGIAEAGQYYRIKLNGSNLASGVYFYRLQNEKKSELKKMMLVK